MKPTKIFMKKRKPRLFWTITAFFTYLMVLVTIKHAKQYFFSESKNPSLMTRGDVIQLKSDVQFGYRSFVARTLLEETVSEADPGNSILILDDSEKETNNREMETDKKLPGLILVLPTKSEQETSEKTKTTLPMESVIDSKDASEKNIENDESSSSEAPEENDDVEVVKAKRMRNCTMPAIEQFPRPMMSLDTRQNGGILLNIFAVIYLFIAIAIICDEFFVPSLEMICDRMQLSEDVAGATFMAAGSSAPELATSIIAVFVAKDDIGISGVIGSAVFNILFVIAICAIFAGHVVELNWWPLVRDCACYCFSICGLLLTIYNDEVSWYDSVFLLIMYGMYIVLMVFNTEAEKWANTLNIPFKKSAREEKNSLFAKNTTNITGTNGTKIMSPPGESSDDQGVENGVKAIENTEIEAAQPKSMVRERKNEDVSPWEMPVGLLERISWIVTLPLVAIHYVTVPDARKVQWRRWFVATFVMSMVWIAIYSYFMVWMITIIGFTFGIPDTVMGLTLIAVGVSVPDALSSLCVVKQGFGDMAVSNAIGSNVFDILICLGFPWFLQTAIFSPGSTVPIESRGLTYSTLSLFSTVVFLIALTHWNGWKLDVRFGIIIMVWYFIFMLFASLYELNVFGYLNPPVCYSAY